MDLEDFENRLIQSLRNLPSKNDAPEGYSLRFRKTIKSELNKPTSHDSIFFFNKLRSKSFALVGIAAGILGLLLFINQTNFQGSHDTNFVANQNENNSLIDNENSIKVSKENEKNPCPSITPTSTPSPINTNKSLITASPTASPKCSESPSLDSNTNLENVEND